MYHDLITKYVTEQMNVLLKWMYGYVLLPLQKQQKQSVICHFFIFSQSLHHCFLHVPICYTVYMI